MARRFHPFIYFHDPESFVGLRDCAAALRISPTLYKMGYELGEFLLNFPPVTKEHTKKKSVVKPVDVSFVDREDLVVQMTRPPLDDIKHGDRKKVNPGHTDLEQHSFEIWREYLFTCARSHVELMPWVAEHLEPGYENRRDIAFFQHKKTAPYKELNAHAGKFDKTIRDRTAVYLLREEEMYPGGPGFIGFFGLDGNSTLYWAYRLGTDLSHLLEEPGFTMAEMECSTGPERPTDLRWVMDLDIRVIARAGVQERAV